MIFQHPSHRGGDRRGRFARLAEAASNLTSSPLFFLICLILITGMVIVHLVHLPVPWLIFAGDVLTSVNLVMLALLKNSERRAEDALQRKLDAIAAAMLEAQEGESHRARDSLRQAIRLEEEL
ncbi:MULTISPECIES: hypothetical protein [unclassified Streptomyces]|uniref:hypothetical protein n=1 Tax=unclassified Streptomyces TaxID=2593676 RepID=UPI002DDC6A05|nr:MULTISPECIES: hypothetical protein [unclassified Streptomyces]WSA90667.1 hypothetical protein OIE63_03310 [Streptomyces sp. NBC_01795]WSB74992.1 hypothetical protein OHB04_03815 [Streptomyces sp. NBC_01775]WSS16729.1 hypothetical protein OG533_36100 [Streptomyces sp. NBC_01186]WSS45547.1 hypothetical protein OG220_36785 [Streptomyces sp. NBC_01187]